MKFLRPRLRLFAPAALAFLLLAGCSSMPVTTRKVISLDRFHRIYVERRLNENNHIDEILVAELQQLGRVASSGPMTMLPDDADAVLTYDAHWQADFTTYLVQLTFELHSVHPHKKVADASYHQPTPQSKAPAVIRKMLTELFTKP